MTLMPRFATYLHPHLNDTSKPIDEIQFMGFSHPYFSQVHEQLAQTLAHYPTIPLRQATFADYERVHTADYLSKLQCMAADEPVADPPQLSIECIGLEYCLPGYLYRLGGMMAAIDAMMAGNLDRAYIGLAPGHHAYPDWGHGYCILNPMAAAARYAQTRGLAKILIVDWDLHHGDGTQAIFANDPSVYCISIHSHLDLYMVLRRVSKAGEIEAGKAVGHCNIPILSDFYDDDFVAKKGLAGSFYRGHESIPVFREALQQIPWTPNLILIFSGYDSHRDDHGKRVMAWTNQDYQTLTKLVLDVAHQANCPVLSAHGGGYTLSVAVSAAAAHVETLATYKSP